MNDHGRNGYKGFLIPFIFWVVTGSGLLIFKDKFVLHQELNSLHSEFLDTFFKSYTHVGDGLFVAACAIVLLIFSYKVTLMVGLSAILSGLLSQFFKRVVFSDQLRPIEYIEQMPHLNLLPALEVSHYFSFPSGHSTSVFAFFFAMSLFFTQASVGIILFFLALLAAFSRVYLSQHFFEDILAGSLLGVFCTIIALFIIAVSPLRKVHGSLAGSVRGISQ